MHKKIFGAIAFFVLYSISTTISASNSWIYVGETVGGNSLFYNADSTQRSGNLVTFWSIFKYSERDNSGALSSTKQKTFNCATNEFITRYTVLHDDFEGNGKILFSFKNNDEWRTINPKSTLSVLFNLICNTKPS